MRALGYYDGYLGFLSDRSHPPDRPDHIIDVGSGTGAFSEAWVAVHGAPRELTLLEPSAQMLEKGTETLAARGVTAHGVQGLLGGVDLAPADLVLAAHVIEHCPDPGLALRQMHDLLHPGGRLNLVVSKPHWCNAIIWLQWRHRTFGRDQIFDLVHQAGFDIEGEYTFPSGPPSRTSRGIMAVRKE